MLSDLLVEGLGVIDRAELSLDRGCSALTGETGAGKTLVVAALSLLLGGRADRSLVREGASEARVEGRFLLPEGHDAVALLVERGLAAEDAPRPVEVVLARTIGANGKVRVNGHLATVSLLGELGALLCDIAGQHEHQRISDGAYQRTLLDWFAGPEATALAREVAMAVRSARGASRRAEELRATERERRREADVLSFEIAEIEAADLRTGESDELAAQAARIEHAEAIAVGVGRAVDALRGERGVEELLASARAAAEGAARHDPGLESLVRRLVDASYEVADIADELAAARTEPDPAALEDVRDRLATIGRLRRKYGDDEAAILHYLDRARARAAELGSLDADLEAAEEHARVEERRAGELAARLGRLRRDAAPRLGRAVAGELERLAMPDARFEVAIIPRPPSEGGSEDVAFLVAPNPGEPPKPIAKIASGGELARIALALHLVAGTSGAPTMVFDEVDAGVGGAAAQEVGRALAGLAGSARTQVIVVTHLPQVAAFADAHFRVTKRTSAGRTVAAVHEVRDEHRIAELSRMLAGLPESNRAREHARELLDLAAQRVGAP